MESVTKNQPHHLILEGRKRLSISGVLDVASFDEKSVICKTNRGGLIVRGSELSVDKLSLEGGELSVEGTVDSIVYESVTQSGGFFARLFR